DGGDGALYGEVPVVAGGVPVELVVALEASPHAGHGVADGVGVAAAGEEDVAIANADAGGVVPGPLDGEGFGVAVALDGADVEAGAEQRAVGVFEGSEDVAEDAAANLVALGIDLDDLGHVDGAVALEGD